MNLKENIEQELKNLSLEQLEKVNDYIESLLSKSSSVEPDDSTKYRSYGLAKGEFEVPDDFDEPINIS